MSIKIRPQTEIKHLHNFWNHIHFHPTDAIEDDWGRRILDQVARDKAAQTVRMYAMLEDIVSMDASGRLQYDFTLNDQRLDEMVARGFNILLSYNFIPPCISSDPTELSTVCKNPTRYKGKFIVTAPPRDWALWEEICYTYTKHITERYGVDKVSEWYLQCFNEPDIGIFFMKNAKSAQERAEHYCKLYEGFERGVRRVSERLKIGGPALAGKLNFLDHFLAYIRKNDKKLDYICFHIYGTEPRQLSGQKPLSVYNGLSHFLQIREICEQHGFAQLPMIIDEWGAASAGFFNSDDFPELMFRETEVFAAYYAKMLILYNNLNLPIEKMMICLSGQHEMKTDFSGFRGFFTQSGYRKPIYNAFALAAKLGTRQIASIRENNLVETVSILPTKCEDGHLALLLVYAADNFCSDLPDAEITLEIEGMQGAHRYQKWCIDRNHANAYRAALALGATENPSPEEREKITQQSENICESGIFEEKINFAMQGNSVMLMEIF